MKPKKLPVKVISVGNISLGGTGKTPAIIFFANHLIKNGKKIGIVSRGYGRKNKDTKILINADKNSNVEDYGDEPIFLSNALRNVPIAVGKNKLSAALQLIEKNKGSKTEITENQNIKAIKKWHIDNMHGYKKYSWHVLR